jgi:cytochrome c peroxidase
LDDGGPVQPYEPPCAGPTPYTLVIPPSLPQPVLPEDNPLTVEGIALGRMLFYDPILSSDSTISCASCHKQEYAFTDGGKQFSEGVGGALGDIHAMAIQNLVYDEDFFWNGRSPSLEDQARHPVENPVEMHEIWPRVIAKLNAHPTYPALFKEAFCANEITVDRVTKAIAQFEMTLISGDSPYDRFLARTGNLTFEQIQGLALFTRDAIRDPNTGVLISSGADCFHCHSQYTLTISDFMNNGLNDVFVGKAQGRFEVTGDPSDMGTFKVPNLRNIAVSGPYMHDGRFNTLEEVIEHYNSQVKDSPTLNPNLSKNLPYGLTLTQDEKDYLLAFLHSLTDSTFLTNPAFSNPFE